MNYDEILSVERKCNEEDLVADILYNNGESEKVFSYEIDLYASWGDTEKQFWYSDRKHANVVEDERDGANGNFRWLDEKSQEEDLA